MKLKYLQMLLIAGLLLLAGNSRVNSSGVVNAAAESYSDLHVCSMHPWIASDGTENCDICGMSLSPLDGHQPGDPLPDEKEIFSSPDNPLYLHLGHGQDPETGTELIPIRESRFYQPRQIEAQPDESGDGHDHSQHMDHEDNADSSDESSLWSCGMHPDVIQGEPGICPICHMNLTPLRVSAGGKSSTVSIDPVTLQNMGVVTVPASRGDLSREIRTNGVVRIADDATVRLNARVKGWVEKLHVARIGDTVRQGQPLLDIYSPELVTAQEEFLLALENATVLSSSELERVADAGEQLLRAARRRLQLWGIDDWQIDELARSGRAGETMTLVAPADGIVTGLFVDEGSALKAGMDIFTITDLSQVWLQLQIYEGELPWVRIGDRVSVTSPWNADLELTGSIDFIYPELDPNTRTAIARVVLPNRDLQLKPDMYLTARLETASRHDVLTVPNSAVIRSGERNVLFIEQGEGEFRAQEVTLGIESGGSIEITAGLAAGENVVLSGQFLLDSEASLQAAIQRRINGHNH
jgi:membrane fusion protein, copper/silver efflux system